MIHIPRWKMVLTLLVCLFGVLYSAPNLINEDARLWTAEHLPGWVPHKTVNLGLDLQGGSHLLLEVDVDNVIRERSEGLVQSLRPELRENRIGYTRIVALPSGMRLTLRDPDDVDLARKLVHGVDQSLEISISEDDRIIEAGFSEVGLREITDQTISQSIEIVRRRVDETGTREPAIQRQGDTRIIVQLPGLDDPSRVKDILGKTAKLTFHLVDVSGRTGASAKELPMADDPARRLPVQRRAMLTGDMLVNAQPSFQQGMPVVSFRLNGIGAKRFCEVTKQNTQRPFAIVLDGEIVSAPNINEPICGGSAVISGSFTVQETNDLAILLRAGALPAPLKILEERTVGPSLGADSVEAGKIASLFGLCFILVFMIIAYGLFGIFANVALVVNVALLFALLSSLQATLTLPGIAGIVLTLGMAVDANVLIFERIREEIKRGRSVLSAIDSGYSQAMSTIVDSNMTTLIAALILFSFGTGPIKGFAVTLGLGIITSFFSAIMVTRLIVVYWMRKRKPDTLPI